MTALKNNKTKADDAYETGIGTQFNAETNKRDEDEEMCVLGIPGRIDDLRVHFWKNLFTFVMLQVDIKIHWTESKILKMLTITKNLSY